MVEQKNPNPLFIVVSVISIIWVFGSIFIAYPLREIAEWWAILIALAIMVATTLVLFWWGLNANARYNK